jgi:ubiquinone biosynthesis protein
VIGGLDACGRAGGGLGGALAGGLDDDPDQALARGETNLQNHVIPLTEAEVVALMERELKVPWEDVFAAIEPDPLASGTIAQVHRPRWPAASAWW